MKSDIPAHLQGILWSVSIDKLDLKKHRQYIIHQVLMFGGFDEIKWLLRKYSLKEVREVFVDNPQKIYTSQAFNFVKNFILGLKKTKVSTTDYVNTIYAST
ncbi:MAG: hypothetical protein AAB546_03165 [Patescibacteria group bacterium]